MLRKHRTNQEAIDKHDILNACKQSRAKVVLLFLDATGANM